MTIRKTGWSTKESFQKAREKASAQYILQMDSDFQDAWETTRLMDMVVSTTQWMTWLVGSGWTTDSSTDLSL